MLHFPPPQSPPLPPGGQKPDEQTRAFCSGSFTVNPAEREFSQSGNRFFPDQEMESHVRGSLSDFTEDGADEEDVLGFPFDERRGGSFRSRDRLCQLECVTAEKLRH